jgi:hypothetical protein
MEDDLFRVECFAWIARKGAASADAYGFTGGSQEPTLTESRLQRHRSPSRKPPQTSGRLTRRSFVPRLISHQDQVSFLPSRRAVGSGDIDDQRGFTSQAMAYSVPVVAVRFFTEIAPKRGRAPSTPAILPAWQGYIACGGQSCGTLVDWLCRGPQKPRSTIDDRADRSVRHMTTGRLTSKAGRESS